MKASEAVEMTMEAIATKSNKLKTVRANYPVKYAKQLNREIKMALRLIKRAARKGGFDTCHFSFKSKDNDSNLWVVNQTCNHLIELGYVSHVYADEFGTQLNIRWDI